MLVRPARTARCSVVSEWRRGTEPQPQLGTEEGKERGWRELSPFFHGRFPLGPQIAPQAWSVCYGGKDRTTEVYSMKVVFLGIRATIYTHNWKNLILARTGMQRPPSRRPSSSSAAAASLLPSDSRCLEAELRRSRRRRHRPEELLVCLLSLPSS